MVVVKEEALEPLEFYTVIVQFNMRYDIMMTTMIMMMMIWFIFFLFTKFSDHHIIIPKQASKSVEKNCVQCVRVCEWGRRNKEREYRAETERDL